LTDLIDMDRVIRIIGVGVVLVVVAFAFGLFRRTVDSIPDRRAERVAAVEEAVERPAGVQVEDGSAPEYLAFAPGLPSGFYRVAEVESSRDRDVRPRGLPGVDYPLETDIVPDASLAGGPPVEPGLYATPFGVRDCSYQLRSVMQDGEDTVIGEDRLLEGRMLVTINEIEPDTFSAVPQCGDWAPWSPLVEPLTVAGDGDYWIGDLVAGTWSVPEGCIWEKVVGFRGAELYDVVESGNGTAPLVVDEDTLGVRIRGCDRPLRVEPVRP
jgi:hypothetical protein